MQPRRDIILSEKLLNEEWEDHEDKHTVHELMISDGFFKPLYIASLPLS